MKFLFKKWKKRKIKSDKLFNAENIHDFWCIEFAQIKPDTALM